ncbi:hypothetical protein RvY_06542 [Ramazzottius varieornatus]|uniref:RING-type E3 ubiquitin transferase n=1 Tax=Ramazzottius varieornatus TaxID=947166 RepID=A0A1D1V4E5_RAMVA|nr:hypothetical protein RvY_06542 [Ramazzottius varieornatus]
MGAYLSRSGQAGSVGASGPDAAAFKFSGRGGTYFADYFIMGGERFESPQPEAYLFGENTDLNFLTRKALACPNPMPTPQELAKPLRSVINIRRESLRLVRLLDEDGAGTGYNIEFNFDADVACTIRIMYFATEEFINHGISYVAQDATLNSPKYSYKKGANQLFSQSSHVFDPTKFPEDQLAYSEEKDVFPVVILCTTAENEEIKQSHVTMGTIDKNPDGTFTLKSLKQKQCIDGFCYLLQEIYGIENKIAALWGENGEEDVEEGGAECVVCISEARDTLILPCRHLCLCSACAENLRYQASNCPICRAPFRALLQIRALQKKEAAMALEPARADEEDIPAGYEVVSLIEALNGPGKFSSAIKSIYKTPPESPIIPPVVFKPTAGPRTKKRSKKGSAPKIVEEAPIAAATSSNDVVSPSTSIRSNISASVPDLNLKVPRKKEGNTRSLPKGLDRVVIVNEVEILPSSLQRTQMDDEDDCGKDSDQTNDSTSSARSLNPLLARVASQESLGDSGEVYVDADAENHSPKTLVRQKK